MPQFYFHLYNGQGRVEDEQGLALPDLTAARKGAIEGLRDILAGDLQRGEINVAAFIEIEDEMHRHVGTVRFADAVTISTKNDFIPR